MSAIVDVIAREILDSRGNPTVEADVLLESGISGRAAVPSGASTGRKEAIELRDGDAARYGGKGVLKAVENVNTEICEAIIGLDAAEQAFIDQTLIDLDGTENKSRLGANAMLAVSLAVAKAAAEESTLPLYRYLGGAGEMAAAGADDEHHQRRRACQQQRRHAGIHDHAGGRAELPRSAALRRGSVPTLKKLIDAKGMTTTVGDEGGFAPNLPDNEAALQLILEAIDKAGYTAGTEVAHRRSIAPRPNSTRTACTSWSPKVRKLTRSQMVDYLATWVDKYPIISIEDGMAEDDWDGWKLLTDAWATRCRSSATTCSSPTPRS